MRRLAFISLLSIIGVSSSGCRKDTTNEAVAAYHSQINEIMNGPVFLAFDVLHHLDSHNKSILYPNKEGLKWILKDSSHQKMEILIETAVFDSFENRYIYPLDHIFKKGTFKLTITDPFHSPNTTITIENAEPNNLKMGLKAAEMKNIQFKITLHRKTARDWHVHSSLLSINNIQYKMEKEIETQLDIMTNNGFNPMKIRSKIDNVDHSELLKTEIPLQIKLSKTCGNIFLEGKETIHTEHSKWHVIYNPFNEPEERCPKRKKYTTGNKEIYSK